LHERVNNLALRSNRHIKGWMNLRKKYSISPTFYKQICAYSILTQKYKGKNVIREKLRKALSSEKAA